jgi:heterodisulfide reductase subunit C
MEKIHSKTICSVNNKISERIVKDAALEAVQACYQCGTCTGSCPSGRRTAIRTRKIIRRVLLGLDEAISSEDIWFCSTCYTCYERCPRDVPVTDVIIKLRNFASQRGYMKPDHVKVTHILSNTGHGVPLGTTKADPGNKWSKMRASYGLSPIPPTTHSHPESLEDCRKIMHITEFDKMIGWPKKDEDEGKETNKEKSKPPKNKK